VSAFPETVPDLLAWRLRNQRDPSLPWLLFEGESWTVGDVDREVSRFAVGLAERGVVRGDRVAILLGNRPQALFAWFAANRLGAIAALLNPAYKQAELVGLLRLMTPRVVVADELGALVTAACMELAPEERPAIASPSELPEEGEAPRAAARPEDVCVLIATSGTTGVPKAVMQTHRSYMLGAEAFPVWVGLSGVDRLLAVLPLFHINAQAYTTLGALAQGSLAMLPRFSASRFWEEARALGATQFNSVGAMMHILLRTPARAADRGHGVRSCYGALALPEATHRAFEERFGLSLSVGYGMSETTFGTVWPLATSREAPRYGTMGRLRQHPRLGEINRARVVREDGGDAGAGESGELWLSNPATMAGYWRDAAQTEAALAGGWLHTGDIVRRDGDGYYTFVSRKRDVIRRRGENVTAAEIEGVLAGFAGVREVAVIGVASELGEEEIVAYVAPDPGVVLDVGALGAWARERLADFKVPGVIHVRESLPHTATERIAKHLLV
jgi:crotonobetaine/carnitine-CoA ligase